MRKCFSSLTVVVLTLVLAGTAAAQGSTRQGWYGSIGGGYGSYDLTGSGFTLPSDYKHAASYYLAVGGSLNQHWRIGAEGDYFKKEFQGQSVTVWYYTGAVAYYPSLTNNFWIKANVGYANTSVSLGVGSESGLAGGLGIGYDWMPGHSAFAVIPFVNYFAQLSGGEFPAPNNGIKLESKLFQFGVGIGYKH